MGWQVRAWNAPAARARWTQTWSCARPRLRALSCSPTTICIGLPRNARVPRWLSRTSLATQGLHLRRWSRCPALGTGAFARSEEHTSELQSLMRISYAVFCLKKQNIYNLFNVTKLHNTHKVTQNTQS